MTSVAQRDLVMRDLGVVSVAAGRLWQLHHARNESTWFMQEGRHVILHVNAVLFSAARALAEGLKYRRESKEGRKAPHPDICRLNFGYPVTFLMSIWASAGMAGGAPPCSLPRNVPCDTACQSSLF